jgi:glycosyl hydrolase family 113
MRTSVSIVLIFLYTGLVSCLSNAEIYPVSGDKINGISFAAAKALIDSTDLIPIKNISATWISLMPYGFIREGETNLNYNSDWQWVGETSEGIKKDIEICKRAGFKIMLKPHVWISHGAYTGDFELETELDWSKFEESYSTYILEFAKIAENQHVEIFCIGTEWRKFIQIRPQFWKSLIKELRKIYTGKLTYASNWDEYKETPFWQQLDYIGINSYFPLTEKANPSLSELKLKWLPITAELKKFSASQRRLILFTEYGYRSIIGTTIKPWESSTSTAVSMNEQEIALSAQYHNTWAESWVAGGFLWKWFNNHRERGGVENDGFTPQNKPAELVIKKYYDLEK